MSSSDVISFRSLSSSIGFETIMKNSEIQKLFSKLSTSLIADASVKLNAPIRFGPPTISPLIKGSKVAGNLTPVKYNGSVSSFLEAIDNSYNGNVLYIDNQGRTDEAVIGDLTVLETQLAGLSGIIVWGYHRDSSNLHNINFPVFSTGRLPVGPRRQLINENSTQETIFLGDFEVLSTDVIFADEDGIIVINGSDVEKILTEAVKIHYIEQKQVAKLNEGLSLRKQFHFSDYMLMKKMKQNYTFNEHLKQLGASI